MLDIHDELEDKILHSWGCLKTETDRMARDFKSHLTQKENEVLKGNPLPMEDELKEFDRSLKWFLDDPILAVKRQRIGRPKDKEAAALEKNRTLKLSPIIAGLALFHFRSRLHDIGMEIVNKARGTVYMAHLVNALKEEGLFKTRWYDLDYVLQSLGLTSFFIGGLPTDREGFAKRFFLQAGLSMTAFAGNGSRPPSHPVPTRNRRRTIEAHIPVTRIFIDRYVNGSGRVNLEPEEIGRILSRNDWGRIFNSDGIWAVCDPSKRPEPSRPSSSRKGNSSSSKQIQAEPREILGSLALILHTEGMQMAFPYVAFEDNCWGILVHVRACCTPVLKTIFGDSPLEHFKKPGYGMAGLIGDIFLEAYGSGVRENQNDWLLRSSAAVVNKLLVDVTASLCIARMGEGAPSYSIKNRRRARERDLAANRPEEVYKRIMEMQREQMAELEQGVDQEQGAQQD
ncbi:hypothetical protein ACHAPT_004286 [Fusarium lateritium]